MLVILRFFAFVFVFFVFVSSYDSFISDGNSSAYGKMEYVVNTSESKVYLAIGIGPVPALTNNVVVLETNTNNVIFSEANITIDNNFVIKKLISLKDLEGEYIGEFAIVGSLAGPPTRCALIVFKFDRANMVTDIRTKTLNECNIIMDAVQKDGDNLYIVGNGDAIFDDKINVVQNIDTFQVGASIYERYLDITPTTLPSLTPQSYLASIDLATLDITNEYSYNLKGANDNNAANIINDLFFTLNFNSDEQKFLTIVGSSPYRNLGTSFTALSMNTTAIDTTSPANLIAPTLIEPVFNLIVHPVPATDLVLGSTVIYGSEYEVANATNITNATGFSEAIITLPYTPKDQGIIKKRDYNLSKLVKGYYNVTLGGKFAEVINWLDVNCSIDADKKYLLPWTQTVVLNIQGLINQLDDKVIYNLCDTNKKFLYKIIDANNTKIRRQWEFIYDKEAPINWMKDVPNANTTGVPQGRIETISADNSSILMLTREEPPISGVHLVRINDSVGSNVTNRTIWQKSFIVGNSTVAKPNLLKTLADDFLIAGNIRDFTREKTNNTDCMVIKIDKNGNELWTRNLGGFHDDTCYGLTIETNNTSPYYNDYIVVGESGTRNAEDGNDPTSYAVVFRDEGTLIHVRDGWSLISNGTDRNITAQGKKEGSHNMGVVNLGAYNDYFQFIKNQWLINKYPIKSLDGFWLHTIDGKHNIFLEGNLIEQKFEDIDTGWSLLGTGTELINAKIKFNLYSVWKFKLGKWEKNPVRINPGEGFWVKKDK